MNDTKPWYASKGVWGGIIAAVAGLAGMFGYAISDADVSSLTEVATGLVAAIGGAVSVIGRIVATKRVG